MAIPIRRAYACPICSQGFAKWGACQSHVYSDGTCRIELGDSLRDLDSLQEACKAAALKEGDAVSLHVSSMSSALTEPALTVASDAPSPSVGTSETAGVVASSLSSAAAPFYPSSMISSWNETQPDALSASVLSSLISNGHTKKNLDSSAETTQLGKKSEGNTTSPGKDANAKLDRSDWIFLRVKTLLDKAVADGTLLQAELKGLSAQIDRLKDMDAMIQILTVTKFLSPANGNLKWITNKTAWLERCLQFSLKSSSPSYTGSGDYPKALVDALAAQAITPDALGKECIEAFATFPGGMQENIIAALKQSLLINISSPLTQHFAHICVNEEVIYNLSGRAKPTCSPAPPSKQYEEIDGTLYHRLTQLLLFRRRLAEETVLGHLAEDESSLVAAGEPGSLLYVHEATREARKEGSAEVLSFLHAAAAHGLERLCVRFIAEGLDINESAGYQETTPLHLAAGSVSVPLVDLLLRMDADPTAMDNEGHSPLYNAVASVALHTDLDDHGIDLPCHQKLQFKVCKSLMLATFRWHSRGRQKRHLDGEDAALEEIQMIAEERQLIPIRNLIHLHRRLRNFQRQASLSQSAILEFFSLQYETAGFVLHIFEDHPLALDEALYLEFRAILDSDFVQERDRLQKSANRLARRLGLSKQAVELLLNYPPEAGRLALQTWKLKETSPFEYVAVDAGSEGQKSSLNQEDTYSFACPPGLEGNADRKSEECTDASVTALLQEPGRVTGFVRKWDVNRHYGFIVQDPQGIEESGPQDVFLHRSNFLGEEAIKNQMNPREGCRVSYILSDQEQKLRALHVAMLNEKGKPFSSHFPSGTSSDLSAAQAGDLSVHSKDVKKDENDITVADGQELSRRFIRHLRSREIQALVREKRPDCEAWLRCVGLRRHNPGRRDDSIWKKEIDKRIDIFLEEHKTPIQKKDFDFKVRRFLNEFCIRSSVARVSEALHFLGQNTATKNRDAVWSWPAYLATLLRQFAPEVHKTLVARDVNKAGTDKKLRAEDDGSWRSKAVTPSHEQDDDDLTSEGDDSDSQEDDADDVAEGAPAPSFAFQ